MRQAELSRFPVAEFKPQHADFPVNVHRAMAALHRQILLQGETGVADGAEMNLPQRVSIRIHRFQANRSSSP